jgi:Domain of unknown function (DUF4265)
MDTPRHVHLLVEYWDGKLSVKPVHAVELGEGRFRLLHSPGFVEGIAAGDEFRVLDGHGAFEVTRRSGNIAVQAFGSDPLAPLAEGLARRVLELAGVLDGQIERGMVFTIPVAAGFPAIESVFNAFVSSYPGGKSEGIGAGRIRALVSSAVVQSCRGESVAGKCGKLEPMDKGSSSGSSSAVRRFRVRFKISRLMIAIAVVAAMLGIGCAKRRMDLFRRLASFHDTMARRYDRLATEAERESDRLRGLIRRLESESVTASTTPVGWRTSSERAAEIWGRAESRTYLKFLRAYASEMVEQATHAHAMSLQLSDVRRRCEGAAARPWQLIRPVTPGTGSEEVWRWAAYHAEEQWLASIYFPGPPALCAFTLEFETVKSRRERLATWRAQAESGLALAAYHGGLRQKYEYAASHPGVAVGPDPPPP